MSGGQTRMSVGQNENESMRDGESVNSVHTAVCDLKMESNLCFTGIFNL